MTSVIPRFGYRVKIGVACEQGLRRSSLQDAYLVACDLGVVAIADGMGSKRGGGLSAQWALEEVARGMATEHSRRIADGYLATPGQEYQRRVLSQLRQIVANAHAQVCAKAEQQGLLEEVGTTLDVIWFLREEAFLAHVGDARVYVDRKSTQIPLTEEHSIHIGAVGRQEPGRSRASGPTRLTNAIGLEGELRVDTLCLDLHRGDRMALLTDGVWESLAKEPQSERFVRGLGAAEAATLLVQRAKESSFDDRTAVIVDILGRFVRHFPSEVEQPLCALPAIRQSALFAQLSPAKLEIALASAIPVEFEKAERIPNCVANDRAAYVILSGTVRSPEGRCLGQGGTLYAESLVACESRDYPFICEDAVRAIRIRRDDYRDLCEREPTLAIELYRRLAEHLGRKLAP